MTQASGKALVVSTSEYKDPAFCKLRAAPSDAELITVWLRNVIGFAQSQVDTVSNDGWVQTRRRLNFLGQAARPTALVVIYFSCHGQSGQQLYFACKDTEARNIATTSVESSLLADVLGQFESSTRQLIILDCCSAGAMFEELARRFPRGTGDPTRAVMAAVAGGGEAYAQDPAVPHKPISPFTLALVETFCKLAVERKGPVSVGRWRDEIYQALNPPDLAEARSPNKAVAYPEPRFLITGGRFEIACDFEQARKLGEELLLLRENPTQVELPPMRTTAPPDDLPAAPPDLNSRFLLSSTFLLAGFGGIAFLLSYLAELALLWLNPIDVMSPTETRYLTYIGMLGPAPAPWSEFLYDFASWCTDTKKLFTYAVFAFWLGLFARLINLFAGDRIRFAPSPLQIRDFEQMRPLGDRGGYLAPFWLNAIVALVFPLIFSPAAMSPCSARVEYNSTVYRFFSALATPSESSGFTTAAFLAYRLFNPIMIYVCGLHLVIGWQFLYRGRVIKPSLAPPITGIALASMGFCAVLLTASGLIEHLVLGEGGRSLVNSVLANRALGIVLFILTVALVARLTRRPVEDPSAAGGRRSPWPVAQPEELRESRSRSRWAGARTLRALGLFSPLFYLALPLLTATPILAVRLHSLTSPSATGSGMRVWLMDSAVQPYCNALRDKGRQDSDPNRRERTATYLDLDARNRDAARDTSKSESEFEVARRAINRSAQASRHEQ